MFARLPQFCFAVALFLAAPPLWAAPHVELKDFLKDPAKYDGKEITLSGYLSLEDYGKALFLTEEDYYRGRFENSVPVLMPGNILDMREAFQRTYVKLRGTYDHKCAKPGIFCSAHPGQGLFGPVREIWGERLPESKTPRYREPAVKTPWDDLTVSEVEDAEHEAIIQLANKVRQAIEAKDVETLLSLAGDERREALKADFASEKGRANWLLFTGDYPYRTAFLTAYQGNRPVSIIPLRIKGDTIEPQVAAVCYCFSIDCMGALQFPLQSDAVVAGSFVDPHKCLPFYKASSGAWEIDAGFLLSTDKEFPFGVDLGTVSDLESGGKKGTTLAAYVYTHPSTQSVYVTRLRERPRPRTLNALELLRIKLPVFYATPSGSLYAMELVKGRLRVRKVEQNEEGSD